LKGRSNTLLIKCEPSGVLIVENNKGDSSASIDYHKLIPLIELGFYQNVSLVCPAIIENVDLSNLVGHNSAFQEQEL
jgi:hypothetical protein